MRAAFLPGRGDGAKKYRWIVLLAGILIQTILGGIYAWSVFVPSLVRHYGIGKGQSGSIFGACIAVFTVSMIFAGRLLSRKGPRLTALIGASFFGAGYLVASYSGGNPVILMVGVGLFTGVGIGFGYVCPLTIGMQWFPRHKGLISGLAVAGFGGGAILLSTVAEHFLDQGMDVLIFFRWMGLCLGGTLVLASLLLAAPEGQPKKSAANGDWTCMRTAPFVLCTIGIFAGTFAGLLVIGHLTPIAGNAGMSLHLATQCVSVFAIGNASGRIVWGHWFDRIGVKSIPLALGGFAAALILFSITRIPWLFLLATGLIGFGFGANFVIYASTLSACFGTDAFPRLYPYCFLGYGIAGMTGPSLGGLLAERTASYQAPLMLSMAVLLAATALTGVYLKRLSCAATPEGR